MSSEGVTMTNGLNGNGNGTAEPEPMIVDTDESVDLNVSCTELTKGGVKYEIILEEPKCSSPPRAASPAVFSAKSTPEISVEALQKKILAANERRQSLESKRLAEVREHSRKIEEAAKKREEEAANFVKETKENLEQKIKVHNENRESIISDLKSKLVNHHTNHLKEVRQSLETSLTDYEEKTKAEIITKLETAEKNREKVLQEKLETLKKHDEKVELIRTRTANKTNTSTDGSDGVVEEVASAPAAESAN